MSIRNLGSDVPRPVVYSIICMILTYALSIYMTILEVQYIPHLDRFAHILYSLRGVSLVLHVAIIYGLLARRNFVRIIANVVFLLIFTATLGGFVSSVAIPSPVLIHLTGMIHYGYPVQILLCLAILIMMNIRRVRLWYKSNS